MASEQLVKQNSQTVDIASGIDIETAETCLFRAHISRGAQKLVETSEERLVGKRFLDGLGDAEVNKLRREVAVVFDDENIARFEIAMNDAFLVRMLHRFTNEN